MTDPSRSRGQAPLRLLKNRNRFPQRPGWWAQQFSEHPVRSLTASAFTLGGLLLLMFFVRLGELPDIDLAASAALLWAIAVMGIVVLLVCIGLPLLPGLFARDQTDGWSKSIADMHWLAVPAVAIIAALIFVIVVTGHLGTLWGWAAGFLGLCWVVMDALWHRTRLSPTAGPSHKAEVLGDMFLGCLSWLGSLLIGAGLAVALYGQSASGWGLLAAFFVMLGTTSMATMLMIRLHKPGALRVLIGILIVGPVLQAMASSSPTAIGVGVVRSLGLGDRPAKLVVSSKGCEVLNRAVGHEVCRVGPGESQAVVCPAILKSRIGNPYYVTVAAFNDSGRWPGEGQDRLIPLAREDVHSWPRIDVRNQVSKQASDVGQTAADTMPVSHLRRGDATKDQQAWLARACGASPASDPAKAPSAAASVGLTNR